MISKDGKIPVERLLAIVPTMQMWAETVMGLKFLPDLAPVIRWNRVGDEAFLSIPTIVPFGPLAFFFKEINFTFSVASMGKLTQDPLEEALPEGNYLVWSIGVHVEHTDGGSNGWDCHARFRAEFVQSSSNLSERLRFSELRKPW